MNSQLGQKTVAGLIVAAAALMFTALVWWPLWNGGGFVGGDVYSYYFPQKVYFAEAIRANDIPLWNNRTGHGYPLVAESQTGPFYPFHLVLYRLLDVNTAYNLNHLLHYAIAFGFAWLFARSVGLGKLAAGFAAFVYTYGWFPARSCWEWAIIGGAWLPAVLWCAERFLATRLWRWAIGIAGFLGLQLLAGHFNLAFITVVTLIAWVAARLWIARDRLSPLTVSIRSRMAVFVIAAVVCGFVLAAAQLLPTWELKKLSQRSAPGANHNLAHGSIPIWYWQQMLFPWRWYDVDVNRDAELGKSAASLGAPTNQVEAHLYFGIVPLALALLELAQAVRTHNREKLVWGAIAIVTLIYTSGLLLPLFKFVPGFSFFQGPGRWGVVTTLFVGLLAGAALDRLRQSASIPIGLWIVAASGLAMWSTLTLAVRKVEAAALTGMSNSLQLGPVPVSDAFLSGLMLLVIIAAIVGTLLIKMEAGSKPGKSGLSRTLLSGCILTATFFDLWLVSGLVKYSEIVNDPPIRYLAESPVRQLLSKFNGTARLFAPSANLPNVLGAGSTPPYLTFGPAAYVDPELKMPDKASPEQVAWLQRAGVTHILSFEPLNTSIWPVVPVWQGFDPLLNRAIARREPFYLYELRGTRGRAAWSDTANQGPIQITSFQPDDVAMDADSTNGGRLIFTDLAYPGWRATIDGAPVEILTADKMFRAVDVPAGKHTIAWTYRPSLVYWGAGLGLVAFLFLAAVAHVRFWHPGRWKWLDP